MTLLQFEILKTVVELGSFTGAGEVVGLTQSAVSHAIKGLETELGFPLLLRGRSGITLTGEGKIILQHIRKILNLSEQLSQEASAILGLQTGTIRIGTFPSVSAKLLPGILKVFSKTYPGIHIEFFEGGYKKIEKWLTEGIVDIGFVSLPSNPDFDTISLIRDNMVVLLPETHPLSEKTSISLQQIASEPFIMPKGGCDLLVKDLFKKRKINPNIQFEISDNNTIFSLVKNGMGISIVPELTLFQEVKGIRVLKLEEETYRKLGLALRSIEDASPAVKVFIQILENWVSSNGYTTQG